MSSMQRRWTAAWGRRGRLGLAPLITITVFLRRQRASAGRWQWPRHPGPEAAFHRQGGGTVLPLCPERASLRRLDRGVRRAALWRRVRALSRHPALGLRLGCRRSLCRDRLVALFRHATALALCGRVPDS